METLFKAVQSGNLKELMELKDQGSDLKLKDEKENSIFFWAASLGHLDIVRWLLEEDIAQIDEQNEAGNTALLLGAAYGHTQLCKWLLDSGAKLTEKNKYGSTALSIALKHNQLPIVDLLIRTYQQSFEQNANIYGNNSALKYYIEIVELFSQNPSNYEDILLLIKNASTQLKNKELSFIYLIYHWLDINNRVNNSSVEAPLAFFVDQLISPHRAELISHMFDAGVILTSDTHKRIIHLDDAQKKSVQDWLKISSEDSYLLSKELETERNDLYNDFYLTPLYHALTYTLKVDGDLNDNLNRALVAPYRYHSNLAEDSFIDVDVAQWTAYHLCRESPHSNDAA